MPDLITIGYFRHLLSTGFSHTWLLEVDAYTRSKKVGLSFTSMFNFGQFLIQA